jgi:hypothetical protein
MILFFTDKDHYDLFSFYEKLALSVFFVIMDKQLLLLIYTASLPPQSVSIPNQNL